MRTYRASLILTTLLTSGLSAQNVVSPWWGTPFPDGTISPGEWDAAPTLSVPTGTGQFCSVAVACDSWGLYFAFMGHLESAARFPEVLLDLDHDRTANWNSDDRWFHVSASACYHEGAYGVFDNCALLPSDWSAHPLMNSGPPFTDDIEVAIPWWYLFASTPQGGDSIGLGLVLTNSVNSWNLWPGGAGTLTPDSWGHLVIPNATGVNEIDAAPFARFRPDPTGDMVHVLCSLSGQLAAELVDMRGRLVRTVRSTGPSFTLDVADLPNGVYVVSLRDPSGRVVRASLLK